MKVHVRVLLQCSVLCAAYIHAILSVFWHALLVARERPNSQSTHNTHRRKGTQFLGGFYSILGDQWQQVTVTCACALSSVSELIHLMLGHPSVLGDTTGKSGALAHQQLSDLILQQ